MHHPSGRRMLAGLAAAVAALGLATPAWADAGAGVDVRLADTTVAVGADTPLQPILYADREVTLTGATMTYQLSGGLAGVSLVDLEGIGDCTNDGPAKLTCTVPYEIDFGPDGVIGYLSAGLKADKTAEPGSAGTVTMTFSADDLAPISRTAKVEVADGVDLEAGTDREIKVKPGGTFDAPLEVRNAGSTVVHGAAVLFATDYAFEATKQFSNCLYRQGQPRACTFEGDLEPGATYQVVLPYKARKETYAPSTVAGEFEWMTPGDYDDWAKYLADNGYDGFGTPGTGGALRLQEIRSSQLSRQTDVNPDNNWQMLTLSVTGNQGSDLAAVGAEVSGSAGAVVNASVGVRNNGPATLDWNRSGESPGTVVVTVPTGTKVVTVPKGCSLAEDDSVRTNPRAVQYVCYTGVLLLAGETVTWKFGLRIDEVIANATGAVEVNPPCACSRFSKDLDKSNDMAAIVVNPAGGQGGGDDGGLPVTGPQGAAIGGAGVLLVVAGVLGFLLARRRRTRFEA